MIRYEEIPYKEYYLLNYSNFTYPNKPPPIPARKLFISETANILEIL